MLKQLLATHEEEITGMRRALHQIPEPSFREEKTSAYILGKLKDFGIEAKRVAGTGVYGIIRGKTAGPVILLRADIDALPVTEETGCGYASEHPGYMHACGHDAHAAALLGAAKLLAALKEDLAGSVMLLFQPAEEILTGAKAVIDEGIMKDTHISACVALHMWPELAAGKLCADPGTAFAACDFFDIHISGKGGHGAMPWLSSDTVTLGARIVSGIYDRAMRGVKPNPASIVSVCAFNSGNAYNIIPAGGEIKGTIRTLDESIREQIHENIRSFADSTAAQSGAKAETAFKRLVPLTVNDTKLSDIVRKAASELLGDDAVIQGLPTTMGSEDFSLFGEFAPLVLVRIGCAPSDGSEVFPLHSPRFMIDEKAVLTAAAVYAGTALDYLRKQV